MRCQFVHVTDVANFFVPRNLFIPVLIEVLQPIDEIKIVVVSDTFPRELQIGYLCCPLRPPVYIETD